MRNLYFVFAILALPLAAFAESGDTMTDQTSLKQSPDSTTVQQHQNQEHYQQKKLKQKKAEKRFQKARTDKDENKDGRENSN